MVAGLPRLERPRRPPPRRRSPASARPSARTASASSTPTSSYDFQTTRPMIDTTVLGPDHHVPEVEIYAAASRTARTTWCWSPAPSRRCAGVSSRRPSSTPPDPRRGTRGAAGRCWPNVVQTHPVHLTGLSPDPAHDRRVRVAGAQLPRDHGHRGGCCSTRPHHHGLQALSLWAPVPHYAAGITNNKGQPALVEALTTVTGVSVEVPDIAA